MTFTKQSFPVLTITTIALLAEPTEAGQWKGAECTSGSGPMHGADGRTRYVEVTAAACAELRARPEMTVAATGPCIQIGTVFPRAWIGPAAFDRRRIGCSATPPGVEPQGGHATDQTSHGCMMKPIGAASSAGQQPKQR